MSLCVGIVGKTLIFAATSFSLNWTHSVEKVAWQEDWQITETGLKLITARVKGSGAGMEPGEGAVLNKGWWEWQPNLVAQKELALAASGTTSSAWQLCTDTNECINLAEQASDAIKLWSCP